jgi:hypothetical protein
MKISFKNTKVYKKNSKRIRNFIQEVISNDNEFELEKDSITLSNIQNTLAKAYGYKSTSDLIEKASVKGVSLDSLNDNEKNQLNYLIATEFEKLFLTKGVSSETSMLIGLGVPTYLQHSINWRDRVLLHGDDFKTYTLCSREWAISVNGLKKELRSHGALNKNSPTRGAILSGLVAVRIGKEYGLGLQLVWDIKFVDKILTQPGVSKPTYIKRLGFVGSRKEAFKNLGELARLFQEICEAESEDNPKNGRPWVYYTWDVDRRMDLPFLFRDIPEDINSYILNYYEELYKQTLTIDFQKSEEAMSSVKNIVNWLIRIYDKS